MGSLRKKRVQSCVKTYLLSSENNPQNVPLPAPKMHFGAIFQPVVPETYAGMFVHYFVRFGHAL